MLATSGFRDRVLLLLMLLASVADLGSTWLVTPDLRLEGNPLVWAMGGGWVALCCSKLLVALIAAVSFRLAGLHLPRLLCHPVRNRDDLVRGLARNSDWMLRVCALPHSLVATVIVTGLFAAGTNLSGWVRDASDLPWFYLLCLLAILLVRRALLWWDYQQLVQGTADERSAADLS